ncbi:GDSL esterase/lipase At5g03610-like [Rhodamnia argentea]|uniref:GDSL esterase/lipase At5g03610-like n=1 Tax=Rhodamnia argentea TaxID=178133 RepID=A0ABM3HE97_9MYRT|nr:GDSL esterase/lipase At5g03610-like [Rhodamnia argentea]
MPMPSRGGSCSGKFGIAESVTRAMTACARRSNIVVGLMERSPDMTRWLRRSSKGHKAVHGSSPHHHHHKHDLQSSSHHHHHHHHHRQQHDLHSSTSDYPEEEPTYAFNPTKLFVFGDSYADTGNLNRLVGRSWKVPYGMTFPGYPLGRFSDGLVFTDLLAKYFGLKSPLPIQWWPLDYWEHATFGTNFAYGGTGVFDTASSDPNMTAQIDCFEGMIRSAIFKVALTQSSVALVTNSGNDYDYYLANGGQISGMVLFIYKVVNQLVANLKRLHAPGVRKIAVAALQPLGCLPQVTSTTKFQSCSQDDNVLVKYHNSLLQHAVDKLNNETSPSTFVMIDLYSAFHSIIVNSTTFKNPMKPCCTGVSSKYLCGNVDANGMKMYTVCDDPSTHFFWDTVHPTQAGWEAVYSTLGPNLDQIRV